MKKNTQLILLISAIILLCPFFTPAQKVILSREEKMKQHHEVPDMPYLPNAFNNQKTSPAQSFRSSDFFTIQVNVNANGQNIVGDAANEPSIAVDPLNPNNIVIGWRQFDNVGSNFRQAGLSFSHNAGLTWTDPGVILEPGIFRSDPVLDYDTTGKFYYNSLTFDGLNYTCKVFKSLDGGADWNAGVEAHGGDKQWMTIDHTNGIGSGNIYATWNNQFTSCPTGNFTRSTDGGASFENCILVAGQPFWGTLTVGNNEELYITGVGNPEGAVVAKSSNAYLGPGSEITWDFISQVDLDGYIEGNSNINPVGILGQAYIDVDRSTGPGRDNVYVLASVQRILSGDPGDVMFAKSTDGGLTWGFPIKVNDDVSTTNTQWFGTMSVAPNGRIDAVWLDTREDQTGSDLSALYYSYSMDQGDTWSVNEKISPAFNPHVGYPQQDKMGDYFDMISGNSGAHLAWANTLNGEEDVYYSFINPLVTGTANITKQDNYSSVSCYPNPCREMTTIRYQLAAEGAVKLTVYNVYGQLIITLVDKHQAAGIYSINFSAVELPAGYYICKLTDGTNTATTRLVRM